MAASAITIDNVTSVSTSEKLISSETNPGSDGIAVAANEMISISCSVGTHANDDITVTLYRSAQISGITKWFAVKSFLIEAGDTDEHEIFTGVGGGPYDIGYVASGSTDTPTVTTVAKKEAVN